MDFRNFLALQYIVFLLVRGIYCDEDCDCNINKSQIEWIQKDHFQFKLEMRLENFKISSRLRRLELTRKTVSTKSDLSRAEGSSKSRADLELKNHKMDVNLTQTAEHLERIDKIENKIIKIEEQLEVTNKNEVSSTNITAQIKRLDEMDSKLVTLTSQVNDIRDSYKMAFDFRNIIRKTILAEKTGKIKFIADIKNQIENIEHLFSDFKTETTTLVHNLSVPLSTKYETFTEQITRQVAEVNDKIQADITLELDDLTNVVSQMKSGISALNKITIEDKTDGGWSDWSSWGQCSESCGGGLRSKTRTCSNPKPSILGTPCLGAIERVSLCNKQTCPDHRIAFTAYGIANFSQGNSAVRFPSVLENYGGGYNATTGVFTSPTAGLYSFSATLTQPYTTHYAAFYCNLYRNNLPMIMLYTFKATENQESFQASGTVSFHLKQNDIVYFVSCRPDIIQNDRSTFFSGILVTPDI